jgi:hypothetical protein
VVDKKTGEIKDGAEPGDYCHDMKSLDPQHREASWSRIVSEFVDRAEVEPRIEDCTRLMQRIRKCAVKLPS